MRNEYPRPSFVRKEYQSLNGDWAFDFDDNNDYIDEKSNKLNKELNKKIVVPFAYQCKASGINDTTHHEVLIYKKVFSLENNLKNKNILLCFNNVDYETIVYLNDFYVGKHIGGYIAFSIDISKYIKEKDNELLIKVIDKYDPTQPRGKQYREGDNSRCWYNSDSGIIGSVWMESFNKDLIKSCLITPNIDDNNVTFLIKSLYEIANSVDISISYCGKEVKKLIVSLDPFETSITLKIHEFDYIDEIHYWDLNNPNLYDVVLTLKHDDEVLDTVDTYFGFRKIHTDETGRIYLNNHPLYQRLILDQGYFVDGDLTCLDVNDLKQDIIQAKEMGFNGARKHQKVEDPYFYYYADKLGFLVWAELPASYRFSIEEIDNVYDLVRHNTENLYNHPSIITWVIFNESWGIRKALIDKKTQNLMRSMYYLVKSIDQTRLVNTNDGWEQVKETDLIALHDYDPNLNGHLEKYTKENMNELYPMAHKALSFNEPYNNQPILLTEYGGISCVSDVNKTFYGYEVVSDSEVFIKRLSNLQTKVYECPFVGFCYTQLTDVKQETNGLLFANRKPKFDKEIIRKIILNEK